MKRVLQLARPEVVPITAAISTLALTTSISLVFPAAVGRILDSTLSQSFAFTPGQIAGGLLALFSVQAVLITTRGMLLTISSERIAARLRKKLFGRMLEQDIAFFDEHRTGDLVNRLSADIQLIRTALTDNVVRALRNGCMIAGGTILVFTLCPSLAALSLGVIPPVAVSTMVYGRYIKRRQKEVQTSLGKAVEVASEAVGSIRTVRQFVQEPMEVRRFGDAVDRTFWQARQVGFASAIYDGSIHMATNIALISVLWYGGTLVLDGAITAGELTSFLMYSLYIGVNIAGLSEAYARMARAVGASSRVFEVIDAQPSIQGGGIALPSGRVAGHVRFEDVGFAYPSRPGEAVLRGFSLDLAPGKVLALVGASGSGKSTIGHLLTRLYDATSGVVSLDGHDIRTVEPRNLRSHIGVVSQDPVLFATSIRENIRYGNPEATDEEVEEAAKQANAHDFITGFRQGYDTIVGERGTLISGGQRQRLAIARAIIKDPAILVLDEATSALDTVSEKAVQEALERVMHERTVIMIAHRLSTVRSADVIGVVSGGQVVEMGTHAELAAKVDGEFSKLVREQQLTG